VTESSPEVVPNGYSFTDTLKATDNEATVSPIASNGTSSHTVSQVSENSDASGHHEVLPVVKKDTEVADTVQQNGEVTLATFNHSLISKVSTESQQQGMVRHDARIAETVHRPLVSEKRTESQQQGMARNMENDAGVAAIVRQNGEAVTKAQEQSIPTIKYEQETQIRSLHIDDDGDEDNIAAATTENGRVMLPEHQTPPGTRVFALNRPHAWHQELSKKRHEATAEDPLIDRQVLALDYFLLMILTIVAVHIYKFGGNN